MRYIRRLYVLCPPLTCTLKTIQRSNLEEGCQRQEEPNWQSNFEGGSYIMYYQCGLQFLV